MPKLILNYPLSSPQAKNLLEVMRQTSNCALVGLSIPPVYIRHYQLTPLGRSIFLVSKPYLVSNLDPLGM